MISKYECNTSSDWLSRMVIGQTVWFSQLEAVLCSNAAKYRKIWRTKLKKGSEEWLVNTDPDFTQFQRVFTCLQYKSSENTAGKEEIGRNEQFLLFPQCFLSVWRTFCHFYQV